MITLFFNFLGKTACHLIIKKSGSKREKSDNYLTSKNKISLVSQTLTRLKVPRTGIEPALRCRNKILSLARLPIPPSGRHFETGCNITEIYFHNSTPLLLFPKSIYNNFSLVREILKLLLIFYLTCSFHNIFKVNYALPAKLYDTHRHYKRRKNSL